MAHYFWRILPGLFCSRPCSRVHHQHGFTRYVPVADLAPVNFDALFMKTYLRQQAGEGTEKNIRMPDEPSNASMTVIGAGSYGAALYHHSGEKRPPGVVLWGRLKHIDHGRSLQRRFASRCAFSIRYARKRLGNALARPVVFILVVVPEAMFSATRAAAD